MTERPLLMSGPLVRATLEDRKTQTRRLLRAAIPPHWRAFAPTEPDGPWTMGFIGPEMVQPCPYGVSGDRLWVRETWRDYALSGAGEPWRIEYRADGAHRDLVRCPDEDHMSCAPQWRPSIHMPRWASRLTLEVTGVRVERLQDISETDAQAEGIPADGEPWATKQRWSDEGRLLWQMSDARPRFQRAWDLINGDRATWASNPWVWVIRFRRVTP